MNKMLHKFGFNSKLSTKSGVYSKLNEAVSKGAAFLLFIVEKKTNKF